MDLLAEYEYGRGFLKGDRLRPRNGCSPFCFDVVNSEVVVLRQNFVVPHKYDVIGENPSPQSPADRIIRFEINGHEWQRVETQLAVEK